MFPMQALRIKMKHASAGISFLLSCHDFVKLEAPTKLLCKIKIKLHAFSKILIQNLQKFIISRISLNRGSLYRGSTVYFLANKSGSSWPFAACHLFVGEANHRGKLSGIWGDPVAYRSQLGMVSAPQLQPGSPYCGQPRHSKPLSPHPILCNKARL